MHVGIIGAMDEEVSAIKEKMTVIEEEKIAHCQFTRGTIDSVNVTLVQSGIGKVNAAMSTTLLIHHYAPDMIINTGSAGGVASDCNVGDLVIAEQVRYHDVDVTAFGYELGQVPGLPPVFIADPDYTKKALAIAHDNQLPGIQGVVSSADTFMQEAQKVQQVKEACPEVMAVEMEAAAIAQVCHQFNTPFVMIRALSDIAGKASNVSFEQFLQTASKNAAQLIDEFVKGLVK
ncbi:5'-methylthioadenosine/S-adenosylhomocysteine nucleosidase [Bacillaceae bacterium SIJ1]|uniref:5'-methylthioadenosine/S-adenosylhomocysteine nucleosidase n=1 Tax=Litoribacterium kuwaitense TaxID=1398745 RepID=UPI0013EE0DA1|nr:5'-methylthioadenosine/S-adenosylhomocysteine nucleosidase [Litoribacterium kuwaitense]NGP43470.1 5'-methylthioadenosine/S-adenosylhomocysteine nucleosidase [Litoribacterium kuwaitense]